MHVHKKKDFVLLLLVCFDASYWIIARVLPMLFLIEDVSISFKTSTEQIVTLGEKNED